MDLDNGTVHLDVSTLQWLVFTALPFLVALVTQRFADSRVKQGLLGLLAFVTAVVQEGLAHGGDFYVPGIISKFVMGLVVAWMTHKFVWEPLRLTGDRGVIAKALPAGVGKVDQVKVVDNEKRVRAGTG